LKTIIAFNFFAGRNPLLEGVARCRRAGVGKPKPWRIQILIALTILGLAVGGGTWFLLREKIRVASGEGRADLLIKNGRVVNVFSGEIEKKMLPSSETWSSGLAIIQQEGPSM
jgi:hypothetical protein